METPTSLAAKIKRFAPTVLTADTTVLAPNDAQALEKIIAGRKVYRSAFPSPDLGGNEALLKSCQPSGAPRT